MSAVSQKFAPSSEAEVTRLVLEHPFAWLVTMASNGDFAATPLPLRPVIDQRGEVSALLGHFARSNPHVELLRRVPRTLILFMGPHGYISSSWLRDRTRTPTWNYASAQYLVDIEFIENDRAYYYSDAALRITRYLQGPARLLYGFMIIPRFIREPIYKWIARNRYKWFGKKDSCMIPTPEVRDRFLD